MARSLGRRHAYFGEAPDANMIHKPTIADFTESESAGKGTYLFHGRIPASESGAYGFNVRVIPTHPILAQAHELRLITWAK